MFCSELSEGIELCDEDDHLVAKSKQLAALAIAQVTLSRILMAMPDMGKLFTTQVRSTFNLKIFSSEPGDHESIHANRLLQSSSTSPKVLRDADSDIFGGDWSLLHDTVGMCSFPAEKCNSCEKVGG